MLWGCLATSTASVLPCTGDRTAEHALGLLATSAVSMLPCTGGRTAECALGLSGYQCCVRTALYRGRDCRTCSWVVSYQCCVRAAVYRGQDCRTCSWVVSYQCCVRAAVYRGQDCRTCSGVVQLPVLCPCCLVQRAGLQNVLWGCPTTSAVSMLPCTGDRAAEHALGLLATSAVSVLPCTEGRTAEHALELSGYQCCVRAALYRGQDCRTCSGVVRLPVLCPCCLVQRAGLQNVLWGCSATSAVSVLSRTAALYRGQDCRTCSGVVWLPV